MGGGGWFGCQLLTLHSSGSVELNLDGWLLRISLAGWVDN